MELPFEKFIYPVKIKKDNFSAATVSYLPQVDITKDSLVVTLFATVEDKSPCKLVKIIPILDDGIVEKFKAESEVSPIFWPPEEFKLCQVIADNKVLLYMSLSITLFDANLDAELKIDKQCLKNFCCLWSCEPAAITEESETDVYCSLWMEPVRTFATLLFKLKFNFV